MSRRFISPISIDLGAKNTGVYFAHYPEKSVLDKIKKSGKVYQLEKDSYTLLMANRTAKRHQRRGYDRRQMVKRLFKLIWEKHFKLLWDKDVQQTISFLLNRRGFTFLTEEYDPEILSQFPRKAYDLLPKELQEEFEKKEESYDFDSALKEWSQDKDKVKSIYLELRVKIYMEEIRYACNQIRSGNNPKPRKNKLSAMDKKILEKIKEKKVRGLNDLSGTFVYVNKKGERKELPFIYGNNVNMEEYLKSRSKEKIQEIENSLPNLGIEKNKLESSIWNFNSKDFKLEKEKEKGKFDLPDESENTAVQNGKVEQSNKKSIEKEKSNKAYIEHLKTHLNHLAFALYKTCNELQSGGCHRSKYFEDVENVLKENNHTHGYLKRFCEKLHSDNFKFKNFIKEETLNGWKKDDSADIEAKALSYLIDHLSNLELKPIRKYFNDKKHEKGDFWDETRLAEKFENWILREWRINLEKDKKKEKGKRGDYKKLKYEWTKLGLKKNNFSEKSKERWRTLKEQWTTQHKGKLINFWVKHGPFSYYPSLSR